MSNYIKAFSSIVRSKPERSEGLDLSHWDPEFDPTKAVRPVGFAFMKLTEGTHFVDSELDTMWKGVKQLDVRGGYHYQRSGMSWELQAKHFLKVASWFDLHVYALDLEEINNSYTDTFFMDARRIIDYWRAKTKKKVVLYSNWSTYKQLYYALKRHYPDAEAWLDGVEFWYAWPSSIFKEPVLPTMRKTWTFWQKSWTGKPADWGTKSAVDVNEFNGTHVQLLQWAGVVATPPQIPEEPEPPVPPEEPAVEPVPERALFQAEVLPGIRIRVRTLPMVVESTLTQLRVNAGETFKGYVWPGNGYLWIKVSESVRPELVDKWIAVRKADGSERLILLTVARQDEPGSVPQLYQVKHWIELGPIVPVSDIRGTPEIYPMMDKHFTRFTRDWQLRSFELMGLPASRWRAVFGHKRAITNDNGFGRPGDPRADYVNRSNLGSPDPKYASLLFGGNVVTGREEIIRGVPWLWVETLDGTKPPPSLEWIHARPWLTQIYTNVTFSTGHVGNFPQGGGAPVRNFILASKPVRIELSKLNKLPLGSPIPKVYWP